MKIYSQAKLEKDNNKFKYKIMFAISHVTKYVQNNVSQKQMIMSLLFKGREHNMDIRENVNVFLKK